MSEIWKMINGCQGLYDVSDMSRVRSYDRVVEDVFHDRIRKRVIKGRILKPSIDKKGYQRVCLSLTNGDKKMMLVHRLVAMAFLPNPDNKKTINHIDGNPSNNRIRNLEWATHKENSQHGAKHGKLNGECMARYGEVNGSWAGGKNE